MAVLYKKKGERRRKEGRKEGETSRVGRQKEKGELEGGGGDGDGVTPR